MRRSKPSRKANICVARGVPVFLLAIIGYVLWVVTKLICADYLLRSQPIPSLGRQPGAAIAILTLLYLLLLFMLVCYGRLVDVVSRRPGLVPRGQQYYIEKSRAAKSAEEDDVHSSAKADGEEKNVIPIPVHGLAQEEDRYDGARLSVEDFWKRDVFVCKYDGRPQFCSSCYNWKPDRSHHCSELNRCVLKMDHFCPWVGGVVGEKSFKFFIQFTFWGALFCLHILVSVAYFFAQRRQVEGSIDVHWAVTMALAGLFFFFSGGMCASSLQFAFVNSTTIENLDKTRKEWCLAIHIPDNKIPHVKSANGEDLRLITYPRPASEQLQLIQHTQALRSGIQPGDSSQQLGSPPPPELHTATNGADTLPPAGLHRTFGIFITERGENPWSLGMFGNFQDIMGDTLLDWLLPLRPSPCSVHDSMTSFYRIGPVVERIKHEAGITEKPNGTSKGKRRRRSRRRRESHHSDR